MGLKWKSEMTTFKSVVIAVETENGEKILENLKTISPFNDEDKWRFEVCSDFNELAMIDPPDVLLLSVYLERDKEWDVLKLVSERFPNTHIVILVGDVKDKIKNFMRRARQELKIENFVTGALPGDGPYTLDLAIRYTSSEVKQGLPEKRGMKDKQEANKGNRFANRVRGQRSRGVQVAVAGIKGGIGKTTICAGLAIGLAGSGIQVTAADTDFSRMDLGAFFKIEPKYGGIEQIDTDMISPAVMENLLVPVPVHPNIQVLPGPENKLDFDAAAFTDEDMIKIMDALASTAPIVLVDTPSNIDNPRNPAILQQSDVVVVVLDQSRFSEQDCREYGEYLLRIGVEPGKVRLVVNKFSSKLHPIKNIQKSFNGGMGSNDIQVSAIIPHDWESFAQNSYRSQIAGLNDPKSQWHRLLVDIANVAGLSYNNKSRRKTGLFSFLKFNRVS